MKYKLLYYENLNFLPETINMMEEYFDIIRLQNPSFDQNEILSNIDILLAPREFKVNSEKIDLCSNLKVIASPTIIAPHVDCEYAKQKNIKVIILGLEKSFLDTITATAELTWGLIIAITRHISTAHQSVMNYEWNGRRFGELTPKMLSNMTIGIIGLGRLGSMVASYAKAFGMKVYYFSPNSQNISYHKCDTLKELAGVSDIVSIHAEHNKKTEKLIDAKFFNEMKKKSYIINTSRGEVIDENALLDALVNGKIAGAALDVLSGEFEKNFTQNLKQSQLIQYANSNDNLIITPHYAGATYSAWEKTQKQLIKLIVKNLDFVV